MRTRGSKGAETLRAIRSAAIDLLSERGYEATNLRTLAKRVGLQAGSLYNYIDSKQHLLFWLLKEGTDRLLAGFDATVEGIEEPQAQMREFVAFHLGYHIANIKESIVLSGEMRSLNAKNYRICTRLLRIYTGRVQDIIERGVAAGKFAVADSQVAAYAILQMLTVAIRWYRPAGRLTPGELVKIYTGMTLMMLGAEVRVAAAQASNGSDAGERLERVQKEAASERT